MTTDHEKDIVLTKAIITIKNKLDLSEDELFEIVGISMKRILNETRLIDNTSKHGELAALLLRLYLRLEGAFGGNVEQMKTWLRSKHQYKGVPAEEIKTIEGLVLCVATLEDRQ